MKNIGLYILAFALCLAMGAKDIDPNSNDWFNNFVNPSMKIPYFVLSGIMAIVGGYLFAKSRNFFKSVPKN